MKTRYSISISKPCHENWSEMTLNQKRCFCQSCSKTVVDFTKMKTDDDQAFIYENKDQCICGHIRQSQLATINLQISETVFEQTVSFHKLFLLALLIAMGTSLLSCQDEKGNTKKVESIEIVEKSVDSLDIDFQTQIDSNISVTTAIIKDNLTIDKPVITKETALTMGDFIITEGELEIVGIPHCPSPERELTDPYNYAKVDVPPMFNDSPKNLGTIEKRDYFKKTIGKFVLEHFEITQGHITLEGRQRINAQFIIDKNGNVKDIKVRAPHKWFEKETKRVISLLPQFTPAKNKGQSAEVVYNLPIIFDIQD
ncbi:MAG: energy transducer TonB [Psychroserpens sp.]|uniref:energy transducer TonB n=1 Tax=Psychroserpens sp. TaxID=2020870 RepID=UPI003CA03EBA